jgi:hypothetical protein
MTFDQSIINQSAAANVDNCLHFERTLLAVCTLSVVSKNPKPCDFSHGALVFPRIMLFRRSKLDFSGIPDFSLLIMRMRRVNRLALFYCFAQPYSSLPAGRCDGKRCTIGIRRDSSGWLGN